MHIALLETPGEDPTDASIQGPFWADGNLPPYNPVW